MSKIVIREGDSVKQAFKSANKVLEDIKVSPTSKPYCSEFEPLLSTFSTKEIPECGKCKNSVLQYDHDSVSASSFGTSYFECLKGVDNTEVYCISPNIKRTYRVTGELKLMYPSEYRRIADGR